MRIIETIGLITTVLAVIGVLANNYRLRWCFLVWFVSTSLSLTVHIMIFRDHADVWPLALRDVVFMVLAVEGYIKWGRKK